MMEAKKSMPEVQSKKKIEPHHRGFLIVLVLFAGFSMYAITSFLTSTEKYIDGMQASVTDANEGDWDELSAPVDCQTCPATILCDSVCEDREVSAVFEDVAPTDPSAKAIETLYFEGIINGYDDGTFKPNETINRAELLTILTSAVDADLSGGYSNCFSDVGTEWFAPFVCYAKVAGWINGYSDGTYRPSQTVNRAEALAIVLSAFEYEIPASVEGSPLADVPATEWYAPVVRAAIDNGVIPEFGNFDAGHQMTRADFAQMVYDAM